MIFGIGADIAKVSRFERWAKNPDIIRRFFNPCEIVGEDGRELVERRIHFLSEHYAARFAAKEAFSKALGTGLSGLELSDFGIKKDGAGKPDFFFGGKTAEILDKRFGKGWKVFVSISHEREFAVSFVIIEKDCQKECFDAEVRDV